MIRFLILGLLFCAPLRAEHIGTFGVDDLATFAVITHSPTTGALSDADSVPSYRIYEDETGTAIATGTMAKLDDANTTGFYSEQVTLSAANGFERGKSYTVYITAAVSSTTAGTVRNFRVARTPAEVYAQGESLGGKFSGMTSLPNWLRLLARKDDGIEADAAADLAEINADLGTGSGAYSVANDSLEGRGDALAGQHATTQTQTTAIKAVTDQIPDGGALTSIAADAETAATGGADNPGLLQSTTIATLTSQTQFTLTAGSSDDDAYNGMVFLPTDQVDSTQKSPRIVADYIGATKTVILRSAPVFTIAEGDSVSILVGSPPADVTALDEPTHLLAMPSRSDGVVRFSKRIRVAPGETVTFGPHFKRGQRVRPDSALQPTGLAGELSATLVGVAPEWVSYQLVVSDAATDGTTDYAVCEVTDKDGGVVQCVFTFDVKELHP